MYKAVYISGPMTGKLGLNRSSFHAAYSKLRAKGHGVFNPAYLPNGLTQEQYMSICQPMVLASSHIYMLKGWESSLGALAELALAKKIGIPVIYEQD